MTNLTSSDFDDFIKKNKIVVVDFWAPWCTPCQMLGPVLEELGVEMADQLSIVKVNVDESSDLALRYNVSSIPAVHVFKDGEDVSNVLGFMPKENYKIFIEKSIQ